jgi:hypothetical protein
MRHNIGASELDHIREKLKRLVDRYVQQVAREVGARSNQTDEVIQVVFPIYRRQDYCQRSDLP